MHELLSLPNCLRRVQQWNILFLCTSLLANQKVADVARYSVKIIWLSECDKIEHFTVVLSCLALK